MPSATPEANQPVHALHEQPRPSVGQGLAPVAHGAFVVGAVLAWDAGWWPLMGLLWMAIAWMDHAALVRLHEAAHGMLVRSRRVNEALGVLIGTLSLTPLSVYRYVHAQHHAHLGREQDPEFWPYNLPGSKRTVRLVYAWLELTAGWIVTPVLYSFRTAAAWSSLSPARRRRLSGEWLLLLGFWSGALVAVARWELWTWFFVGHLGPAWIVGSIQTVRKFTEHMGRFGDTILEMTRTVSYAGPVGRAASRSQLHVEHHGTHHRWARIPYYHLPAATKIVYGDAAQHSVYPNHWAAIREMLPYLFDPRLGPQWRTGPPGPERRNRSSVP